MRFTRIPPKSTAGITEPDHVEALTRAATAICRTISKRRGFCGDETAQEQRAFGERFQVRGCANDAE
jgi:hypothetical protein